MDALAFFFFFPVAFGFVAVKSSPGGVWLLSWLNNEAIHSKKKTKTKTVCPSPFRAGPAVWRHEGMLLLQNHPSAESVAGLTRAAKVPFSHPALANPASRAATELVFPSFSPQKASNPAGGGKREPPWRAHGWRGRRPLRQSSCGRVTPHVGSGALAKSQAFVSI